MGIRGCGPEAQITRTVLIKRSSIDVKHLDQLPRGGRVVREGFHQRRHVIPPLADDGEARQVGSRVAIGEFLHGEEGEGFRVEEDRVVGNAGVAEGLSERGPERVMAAPVFGLAAGLIIYP